MAITTIAQLVRAARNGRSQKEFARELGIGQSMVSRYESGRTNPPVKVIEHCMHIVHTMNAKPVPTANELATKVLTLLANPDLGEFRLALARLIDILANNQSRARPVSPSSR